MKRGERAAGGAAGEATTEATPTEVDEATTEANAEAIIDVEELVARALEAQERAYAPYSGYPVGAAILAGGAVHTGANVENASYGLALCAERSAVARAVFAGARRLDAAAVATSSSPPAAPCGMCLQTLTEFAGDPTALRVILVNPAGERRELTLAELLPHGFRRDQLTPGGGG